MIKLHPLGFDADRLTDALCGGQGDVGHGSANHRTEDGRAKSRRVALVKSQMIRTT
jgi:hypothetical protein